MDNNDEYSIDCFFHVPELNGVFFLTFHKQIFNCFLIIKLFFSVLTRIFCLFNFLFIYFLFAIIKIQKTVASLAKLGYISLGDETTTKNIYDIIQVTDYC